MTVKAISLGRHVVNIAICVVHTALAVALILLYTAAGKTIFAFGVSLIAISGILVAGRGRKKRKDALGESRGLAPEERDAMDRRAIEMPASGLRPYKWQVLIGYAVFTLSLIVLAILGILRMPPR
jgi:hypothetical protein